MGIEVANLRGHSEPLETEVTDHLNMRGARALTLAMKEDFDAGYDSLDAVD
jgi:hypothetical protein